MDTDRYRVVLGERGKHVARTFPDRTAAETYRENLKALLSNPARIQVQAADGTWIDTEPAEVK